MLRTAVPLFGTALKSRSVIVSAQRRLNCYIESAGEDQEKGPFSIHGIPGLTLFADLGLIVRANYSDIVGDRVFYLAGNTLFEVSSGATIVSRGTIGTSSGRASMASNGTQIMIVDGSLGYIYNTGTTVLAQITDVDFPANPTTVVFHNGRFLVSFANSGRMYGSSIYDGLSWIGTDFVTAESNPDNLIAVDVSRGDAVLFGSDTTEFFQDVGGSGFPYLRIQGATADWGLAARDSIGRVGDTLMFLSRRAGEPVVIKLDGYQSEVVSDTDTAYNISRLSRVDDATGFGYMHGGHAFYQLNFPIAQKSFLYDDTSGLWSELQSYGMSRHRGETVARVGAKTLISDSTNGKIYYVNPDDMTENFEAVPFEVIGRHIFNADNQQFLGEIQADFETGVGTVNGLDPQAMLNISRDGGHTYGTDRWTSIGKLGEYKRRAIWRRNGNARDMTIRLRVTDPVKRVLTGASAIFVQGTS